LWKVSLLSIEMNDDRLSPCTKLLLSSIKTLGVKEEECRHCCYLNQISTVFQKKTLTNIGLACEALPVLKYGAAGDFTIEFVSRA